MFASLWLPDFRLQSALRWRDTRGPVALVDGDAAKGVLLEANAGALASGAVIGLTPAQALARCPELRIVMRSSAQERACQALLVELALEFSPTVEATADGVCTMDLSGVSKRTCWQKLAEAMVARCKGEGLVAHVGVAPHPDHAWLAACRAQPVNVVYDGAPFCAALPMEVLEPSAELRMVLADWGIRTVGEFMKLPAQGLVERLGAEAAELRRRVSARSKRVLRLVRPTEQFVEAFDFEYAIESIEPLLFLLRRFVDALSARLRGMHRVADGLVLTLPLDRGGEHTRTFSIPAPTADAEVWFRILSTHLESLRLKRQPLGVRLEIRAADPAGRQLNLFESALRDPNRFGETLAQLKALVGEDGVGVPQPADTHRPGAFDLQPFDEAAGERPSLLKGLPLRRHRSPGRLAVKLANERPAWVEGFGPVARLAGPYRLSGEWWAKSWWIEEWDVELSGGETLRLGRTSTGQWSWEGDYEVC